MCTHTHTHTHTHTPKVTEIGISSKYFQRAYDNAHPLNQAWEAKCDKDHSANANYQHISQTIVFYMCNVAYLQGDCVMRFIQRNLQTFGDSEVILIYCAAPI